MSNIQLDYSDITDIFKEKLKIENIVKKVSSIFLNQRYSGKINYKPYFQRNYVWDEEKATYFIESILLGTEIPPLVLFQTKDKNEVIDGRQRYETIKRFLEDKLVLKGKGLHSLKVLEGKKYSQLDESTRELFEDTRIRILQFNVVDEPKLDEEKEEKIKEKRAAKKAEEEKAAKKRAEKSAEGKETGDYTLSVTGNDVKSMTQSLVAESVSISAPDRSSFDIKA